MQDAPLLLAAAAVGGSLAWTWFAFFRRRVSFRVAARRTRPVARVCTGNGKGSYTGHWWEDGYFLVDQRGREYEVDESVYLRAGVGRKITLRQWVDRWRLG